MAKFMKIATEKAALGSLEARVHLSAKEINTYCPDGTIKSELTFDVLIYAVHPKTQMLIGIAEEVKILDSIRNLSYYKENQLDKSIRYSCIGYCIVEGAEGYHNVQKLIRRMKVNIHDEWLDTKIDKEAERSS